MFDNPAQPDTPPRSSLDDHYELHPAASVFLSFGMILCSLVVFTVESERTRVIGMVLAAIMLGVLWSAHLPIWRPKRVPSVYDEPQ